MDIAYQGAQPGKNIKLPLAPLSAESRIAFIEHCAWSFFTALVSSDKSAPAAIPIDNDQRRALFTKLDTEWRDSHRYWGRGFTLNFSQYETRRIISQLMIADSSGEVPAYQVAMLFPLALEEIRSVTSSNNLTDKVRIRGAQILIEKVEAAYKAFLRKIPSHDQTDAQATDTKKRLLIEQFGLSRSVIAPQLLSESEEFITTKLRNGLSPLLCCLTASADARIIKAFNLHGATQRPITTSDRIFSVLGLLGVNDDESEKALTKYCYESRLVDAEMLPKLLPCVEKAFVASMLTDGIITDEYMLIRRKGFSTEQSSTYQWIRFIYTAVDDRLAHQLDALTPQTIHRQTLIVQSAEATKVFSIKSNREPVVVEESLACTIGNYLPIEPEHVERVLEQFEQQETGIREMIQTAKIVPFSTLRLSFE